MWKLDNLRVLRLFGHEDEIRSTQENPFVVERFHMDGPPPKYSNKNNLTNYRKAGESGQLTNKSFEYFSEQNILGCGAEVAFSVYPD